VAKYKNNDTFLLNYAQTVVILKSKAVINFRIIKEVDFFSQMAEICSRLAENFFQKLATLKAGAKDLVWLTV
jgi:hypothetical protein